MRKKEQGDTIGIGTGARLAHAHAAISDIAWSGMARAKVSDSLSHTLELLKATRTSVLPVIDADGSLAGIISMNDVLLALARV